MILCIIAGLLLEERLSRTGHITAWAVLAAGVLQVAFILRATAAAGIRISAPSLGLSITMRRFFRNFLPAALSSGVLQIAVILDTILASLLTERALALQRRNRIEIMFGRLKDWRRVATRYDRCPETFLSAIAIAVTILFWL